jgi:flagellar biosynthesis protein
MAQQYQAVALGFTQDEADSPPVVSVKGSYQVAETMMAIARRHGIPVVERAELATALEQVPVDAPIPAKLFRAAAALLAEVGNLARRR